MLVFLILTQIKLIILIVLAISILIKIESDNILNSKKYDFKTRKGAYAIRPINWTKKPDNIPIGTMLYYHYYNLVFSYTYGRIQGGSFFWFKEIRAMDLAKILFFIYIDISRLMLRLLKLVLMAQRSKSVEEFLYPRLVHYWDSRLIIYYKNEWHLNGKPDKRIFKTLGESWEIKKFLEKNVEHSDVRKRLEDPLSKDARFMKEMVYSTPVTETRFAFKNTLAHKTYPELARDKNFWAYSTSASKAREKGNYGLSCLLDSYKDKHETTLLLIPSDQVIELREAEQVIIPEITIGASLNNFNEPLADPRFVEVVKEFRPVLNHTIEVLNEAGIHHKLNEYVHHLLKEIK